jgi:hypothetical protein
MALAMAGYLATAVSSQALTYGFTNISGNDVNNTTSGEAQLSVDVTDAGTGQVLFTFNNAGPDAMSITDVYFDDGHLLGISSIESSTGVSYTQGAAPGNLPSANNINPSFSTTAGFSADSDPAVQPNGVNPGEWLKIYFELKESDQTYQTVIDDLANGSLRIGIHVQGFDGGGSEAFVNGGTPPNNVPDATASIMLLGIALMGVEGYRRRFNR